MVPLLGNHEEMLLNALESKSEFRYWFKLGGKQTLESYSFVQVGPGSDPGRACRVHPALPEYFETQTHIFVHANYEPALPMHQIDGGKLRWEHLDVIRLRPHCSGKTVVVGHTPQMVGTVLDLGFLVGIDTDCCRAGWLTAFDVSTGGIVQADQSGKIRRFSRTGVKS